MRKALYLHLSSNVQVKYCISRIPNSQMCSRTLLDYVSAHEGTSCTHIINNIRAPRGVYAHTHIWRCVVTFVPLTILYACVQNECKTFDKFSTPHTQKTSRRPNTWQAFSGRGNVALQCGSVAVALRSHLLRATADARGIQFVSRV